MCIYTLSFIKRLNLLLNIFSTIKKEKRIKEFPGSSVVRSLNFHCQGPRFNPCGELRSHKLCDRFKKLTKKKKNIIQASFQDETGQDRPRNREQKKFPSYPFEPDPS